MEFLTKLKGTLAGLGPAKLGAMAALAACLVVGIAWIAVRSNDSMGLLYSGLDLAEAGRIGQKLEEMKVPFEARGDGSVLMVPASQVARVRMELAAAGLPDQAGAGYELLDKQSPMNMTSFMQRVQRTRALEGELARSIVALDTVRTARVHIVMPERDTFSRDVPKPTASVAVVMRGAMRLSASQAAAIRLLVSGAVPGLRQEDVSVLDPSGIVLAADGGDALVNSRLAELKLSDEQQLQKGVTSLLEPLVGRGKVRVIASVDIDSSRQVTQDVKYDPQSQVERSKQTQVDKEQSDNTRQTPSVSVAQNLPNQPQQQSGSGEKTASSSSHDGQTVNYEINTTRDEKVKEPGGIHRLTVAVVVDGVTDAKGAYTPRPKEELDRMAELVRSAVGADAKRGDVVTVDTMHFIADDSVGTAADAGPSGTASSLNWITSAGLVLVLLVVAGTAAAVVLRKGTPRIDLARSAEPPALPAAIAAAAGDAPGLPNPAAADAAKLAPPVGLSLPAIEGPLTELYQLFDARPEEALAVLRAWIADAA